MSNFRLEKEARRAQVTYKLTNAQLDQLKQEAVRKGVEAAFNAFIGIGCAVLHNSFGFGQERCTSYAERCLEMFKRLDTEGGYDIRKIEEFGAKYGGIKIV